MFVDTHCHIHEPVFTLDVEESLSRAQVAGVEKYLCVGTSEESSKLAIAFSAHHPGAFATVGVHPHDTKDGSKRLLNLPASRVL